MLVTLVKHGLKTLGLIVATTRDDELVLKRKSEPLPQYNRKPSGMCLGKYGLTRRTGHEKSSSPAVRNWFEDEDEPAAQRTEETAERNGKMRQSSHGRTV